MRMKYANLSINTYLNKLASKSPVPGGGSAAALFGAIGCALIEMVIDYSVNKKRVKSKIAALKNYRTQFMKLIDEDAVAYNRLSLCYKQFDKNSSKTQAALKKATLVPFKTCNKSFETMKICSGLVGLINKNLISDIGCAASGLRCAFESAIFNININIKYIKDKKFVNSVRKRIAALNRKLSFLEKNKLKAIIEAKPR